MTCLSQPWSGPTRTRILASLASGFKTTLCSKSAMCPIVILWTPVFISITYTCIKTSAFSSKHPKSIHLKFLVSSMNLTNMTGGINGEIKERAKSFQVYGYPLDAITFPKQAHGSLFKSTCSWFMSLKRISSKGVKIRGKITSVSGFPKRTLKSILLSNITMLWSKCFRFSMVITWFKLILYNKSLSTE